MELSNMASWDCTSDDLVTKVRNSRTTPLLSNVIYQLEVLPPSPEACMGTHSLWLYKISWEGDTPI